MRNHQIDDIEESHIRETLIGLLEDFQEHAEVAIEAKKDIHATAGSDRFDRAVARLDAALTSLEVTVPAILRQLDQLDEIPEEDETEQTYHERELVKAQR